MRPDFMARSGFDPLSMVSRRGFRWAWLNKPAAQPLLQPYDSLHPDALQPSDDCRAQLRALGQLDQSVLQGYVELAMHAAFLESDAVWIDDDIRVGLAGAADRALLALSAIPASGLADLRIKVAAYAAGAAYNPLRSLSGVMLRAAISADVERLAPAPAPDWLRDWIESAEAHPRPA